MDETIIIEFLKEIERVLVPSGHLFLWVDKFHLCAGIKEWFVDLDFEIVDMITWNKQRMGMGYRTRRCSEHLVVLQKLPKRAKNIWRDHGIRDVWDEKIDKKNHTHAKPIQLQKQLIKAVTPKNAVVIDPAAGGYSVLRACLDTDRNFIGCDLKKFLVSKI